MLSKTKYAALCVLGTEIFYLFVHRLRIGALRQSDGPASQPFRTDSGFRLGKSAEHGLGRSLSRGFGLDRRLVHRVDAQRESERRK